MQGTDKQIFSRIITIGATLSVAAGLLAFVHFSAADSSDPVQITIDGQEPWQAAYQMDGVMPGHGKQKNFIIENTGENPANISIKISGAANAGGAQSEPECVAESGTWDDLQKACQGAAAEKNDIETQIDYKLEAEKCPAGGLFCEPVQTKFDATLDQAMGKNIVLGILQTGDKLKVYQTYGLKKSVGNEYQGDQTDFSITVGADDNGLMAQTIRIDQLGGDINNQFGYNHDYSAARVDFNYDSPAAGKLSGKITAAVLKPYATYQLKFEGKPSCQYGTGGNDLANEYIGYRGRWWDRTINANVNDAQYAANSVYKGGTHCIVGYLVWDHFTADAAGVAVKDVQTLSSYHVLWCSGGACGAASNTKLANLDASHPALKFCAPEDVNGQLERGGCGNLVLESGNYDLKMILTEESFHNGNWASVLQKDISFTIE